MSIKDTHGHLTREFYWLRVVMSQLHGLIIQVLSSLKTLRWIFTPTYKLRITSYQRLRRLQPAVPYDPTSSFPPLDTPVAIPSIALSIHLSFPQATAFDLLLHSPCQPALPPLPLYKQPFSSPSRFLLVSLSSFSQSFREEQQRLSFVHDTPGSKAETFHYSDLVLFLCFNLLQASCGM